MNVQLPSKPWMDLIIASGIALGFTPGQAFDFWLMRWEREHGEDPEFWPVPKPIEETPPVPTRA